MLGCGSVVPVASRRLSIGVGVSCIPVRVSDLPTEVSQSVAVGVSGLGDSLSTAAGVSGLLTEGSPGTDAGVSGLLPGGLSGTTTEAVSGLSAESSRLIGA